MIPITAGAITMKVAGSTEPVLEVSEVQTNIFIEEVEVKKSWTKEEIKVIVREATNRYNVSFDEVWTKIGCETQWTYDPFIQSSVRYSFNSPRRGIVMGEQERSFGISAIHLPDHPSITYEQAVDPVFAADFMAKNWAEHSGWWYCK